MKMECNHKKPSPEEMDAMGKFANELTRDAGVIAINNCQTQAMIYILNQPTPEGMGEHEAAAARASAFAVITPQILIDAKESERELLQGLISKAHMIEALHKAIKTAKTAQNN